MYHMAYVSIVDIWYAVSVYLCGHVSDNVCVDFKWFEAEWYIYIHTAWYIWESFAYKVTYHTQWIQYWVRTPCEHMYACLYAYLRTHIWFLHNCFWIKKKTDGRWRHAARLQLQLRPCVSNLCSLELEPLSQFVHVLPLYHSIYFFYSPGAFTAFHKSWKKTFAQSGPAGNVTRAIKRLTFFMHRLPVTISVVTATHCDASSCQAWGFTVKSRSTTVHWRTSTVTVFFLVQGMQLWEYAVYAALRICRCMYDPLYVYHRTSTVTVVFLVQVMQV
jgi:hypothetical protein